MDGKINDLLDDYEHSKQSSINTIQPSFGKNQEVFNSSTSSSVIETEADKSTGGYSLQSGAYISQGNAENQQIYLINSGFNAHITELYRQTKILYAVRIGYYDTAKEAEEVSSKIKSMLVLDTIVVENK